MFLAHEAVRTEMDEMRCMLYSALSLVTVSEADDSTRRSVSTRIRRN
jgi:hypothetical protein